MLVSPENDPLLASLQGIDRVIDHFVKNAQGWFYNLIFL